MVTSYYQKTNLLSPPMLTFLTEFQERLRENKFTNSWGKKVRAYQMLTNSLCANRALTDVINCSKNKLRPVVQYRNQEIEYGKFFSFYMHFEMYNWLCWQPCSQTTTSARPATEDFSGNVRPSKPVLDRQPLRPSLVQRPNIW